MEATLQHAAEGELATIGSRLPANAAKRARPLQITLSAFKNGKSRHGGTALSIASPDMLDFLPYRHIINASENPGNDPRLRGSGGQGGGRAQYLPIVAGIPVLICKGAGREPTDNGMLGCGDKRWPLSDV